MIRRELHDGVLTVTIDRQDAKNALTLAMRHEIEGLPDEVNGDDDVAVVVFTATEPIFCAGADLKEIAAAGDAMPPTRPGAALRAITKPCFAAVGGACVTGGLELALSCDFIVASDRARFSDTHAKIGVLPRWGMSALLPRRVGLARAKEISLSGRWVDADEAERIGLVNRVFPHDAWRDRVMELAREIAGNPRKAVGATRSLLDRGESLSLRDALELEEDVAGAFTVDPSSLRPARHDRRQG